MDLAAFDNDFRNRGFTNIVGLDEAGRGPWAGPVVAAAVILPIEPHINGIKDSKKLTERSREKLFYQINELALAIGIDVIDHTIIDSINILEASFLAMKGALKKISKAFDLVLVDGWPIPNLEHNQLPIKGGDGKSESIAAASIVAKVTRDKIMTKLSGQYPQYNFHKHKGYGTKEHYNALMEHGPCFIHRKSFAPVRKCIEVLNA